MTNRKPFDLEKALAGEPVLTEDGRKAEYLGSFYKYNPDFPHLFAVYSDVIQNADLEYYDNVGQVENVGEDDLYLYMTTRKKTLWVAVRKVPFNDGTHFCCDAKESREDVVSFLGEKVDANEYQIMPIEIEV